MYVGMCIFPEEKDLFKIFITIMDFKNTQKTDISSSLSIYASVLYAKHQMFFLNRGWHCAEHDVKATVEA